MIEIATEEEPKYTQTNTIPHGIITVIELFETGVVCGCYVSSTYAGSDGYREATA